MTTGVQHRLREDILNGKLAPGSKLAIQKLQVDYGSGQNPLREALSGLVAEGLVTAEEQRGFSVAPVSLEELADLTVLRDQLECMALRRSMERGTPAWQGRVLAVNHELRSIDVRNPDNPAQLSEEWERKHAEFHRTLISACGSPWLIRLCGMIFDQSSRYRRLLLRSEVSAPVALNVYRSHDEIVAAIVANDVERAVELLQDNFVKATDLHPDGDLPEADSSSFRHGAGRRNGASGRNGAKLARRSSSP